MDINKINPESHLGLVYKIAGKYKSNYIDYDDVVGYGMIGLVEAANRFDEAKGYKFSTYATKYIHSYILKAIKNDALILVDDIEKMDSPIEDFAEDITTEILIDSILSKLSNRERQYLELYVLSGKRFSDIARETGVSRQSVSISVSNARKKIEPILRNYIKGA